MDPTPDAPSPRKHRISAPWSATAAWARVLDDGGLELELNDSGAQGAYDGRARKYRVEADERYRMCALLEQRIGLPIRDDGMLIASLANSFADVHALREWLRDNGIRYE